MIGDGQAQRAPPLTRGGDQVMCTKGGLAGIHQRVLAVSVALSVVSACMDTSTGPAPAVAVPPAVGAAQEITRERAIEIARQHVTFEPTSTEAVSTVREGKQVWVVTFRRAGQSGGLGQFMEVTIDRATGMVVSLAMS